MTSNNNFIGPERPADTAHPILHAILEEPARHSKETEKLLIFLGITRNEAVIKSYNDAEYWNYYSKGISLCFDKKDSFVLSAVHIYSQCYELLQKQKRPQSKAQKFKAYNGPELPYGIRHNATLKDIIHKFAPVEPSKGGGSSSGISTWIKYSQYFVMIDFHASNFDDAEANWTEITFADFINVV